MTGEPTSDPRSRQRRSRRYLIAAPLAALATAGIAFWLGVGLRYAILLALCLLLVAACTPITGVPSWLQFRRLPYSRRDGARRDVSTLSWSLYGDHRALRGPAVQRLHNAGVHACTLAGVDLSTDAGLADARNRLDEATVDFLVDPEARPVHARDLQHYLTTLDRLDLTKA